jgi:AsmA family protein
MAQRRLPRLAIWAGIPVVIIVLLVAFWNWDWFIPVVQGRASAALQRPVTIGHLHVGLGRIAHVTADDVVVANPTDWKQEDAPPLARIGTLALDVDIWEYVRHGALVLPSIALDHPDVTLLQERDGTSNYNLKVGGSSSGGTTKIGDLRIANGQVVAKLAKLRTDMTIGLETQGEGDQAKILATAKGTYGEAPITGKATGGALLSMRDATTPWPIDLRVENGATHVELVGTLQQPLHLDGANLKLQLAGPDMGQLEPLTGIPIPKTPPYKITGNLDFAAQRIQFKNFHGSVGNSDLEGIFDFDPNKGKRPELTADLASRRVDLADLGGFLGTEPGRVNTPGKTPAQKTETAKAEAKPNLLPDKPISIPRLTWADIHLKYRGARIEGRSVPFDNMTATLDIEDGAIRLHPLSLGVGQGQIVGNIALTPRNDRQLHAKADIDLRQVDVSRMMAATHAFQGAGTVSGTATIDSVGNSLATILGNGDGHVRMGMAGGDLSALLVDLSGLEFGNALMSALGVPKRTQIECLVDDMPLENGVLTIHALVLDTGEAIVNGTGSIDLRNEKLDLSLKTESKHFTIGSLPAPINIGGTFKSPSIRPGAELAARGGAAAGLAAVFPPLALLPTIQFGVGDDHRCDRLLHQAKEESPKGGRLPAPKFEKTTR